jgi:hypothetical protein
VITEERRISALAIPMMALRYWGGVQPILSGENLTAEP